MDVSKVQIKAMRDDCTAKNRFRFKISSESSTVFDNWSLNLAFTFDPITFVSDIIMSVVHLNRTNFKSLKEFRIKLNIARLHLEKLKHFVISKSLGM